MSLETWCGLAGAWRGTYALRGDPSFAGDFATVVWIDSWHNGPRMLTSIGSSDNGTIEVRGVYPTGVDSPEWSWRTRLEAAAQAWTMTMFNVSPDGDETLAVSATYQR